MSENSRHRIDHLYANGRPGSSGLWHLSPESGGRNDCRHSSAEVVRQDRRDRPYGTVGQHGDHGRFQGRPEYPCIRQEGTRERSGYPTVREWNSRRGVDRPRFQTELMAVRGIDYEEGDHDWYHDQHRRGFYSREGPQQCQGFWEPPEDIPQWIDLGPLPLARRTQQ